MRYVHVRHWPTVSFPSFLQAREIEYLVIMQHITTTPWNAPKELGFSHATLYLCIRYYRQTCLHHSVFFSFWSVVVQYGYKHSHGSQATEIRLVEEGGQVQVWEREEKETAGRREGWFGLASGVRRLLQLYYLMRPRHINERLVDLIWKVEHRWTAYAGESARRRKMHATWRRFTLQHRLTRRHSRADGLGFRFDICTHTFRDCSNADVWCALGKEEKKKDWESGRVKLAAETRCTGRLLPIRRHRHTPSCTLVQRLLFQMYLCVCVSYLRGVAFILVLQTFVQLCLPLNVKTFGLRRKLSGNRTYIRNVS